MRRRTYLLVAAIVAVLAAVATPVAPVPATTIFLDTALIYQAGPGPDAAWHNGVVKPISISGSYMPVVGNFVGDSIDDVLWYGPGSKPDALWEMHLDGTHVSHPIEPIGGNFHPVAGRFRLTGADDPHDDIVWYGPGAAPDLFWDFLPNGAVGVTSLSIGGTYEPVVGGFKRSYPGDTTDDLLWLSAGGTSTLWDYNFGSTISKSSWNFGAEATPVVVNTGQHEDRLFLYRPGPAVDRLVNLVTGAGTNYAVNGQYTAVVGDFGAGPGQSIIWYSYPFGGPDPQWDWNGSTFVHTATRSVNGIYSPLVGRYTALSGGDVPGDKSQVLWYDPTTGRSPVWRFTDGALSTASVTLPREGRPFLLRL